MTAPIWQTPAGFIGSLTQSAVASVPLSALGSDITYTIINGHIPPGLFFTPNGQLSGSPLPVGQTTRNQFTVRASNPDGISDRTFIIDISGHIGPQWLTPPGQIALGLYGNIYAVNYEIVDYQLSADEIKLPTGHALTYYIAENDGTLPPGLTLIPSGRIVGQIKDSLLLDYAASNLAEYDEEFYDRYPYDHVGITFSGFTDTPRYIPKTYQFYVTVTDSVLTSRRFFSIVVQDPNNFRIDNTFIDVDTTILTADANYLLAPQWLTPANLGVIRANNNISIPLNVYDFEPYLGYTSYDWNATLNQDGSPSVHPPGFNLSADTGVLYAFVPYEPAFNVTYNFTVNVTKTDRANFDVSTSSRTFTLVVKGALDNNIEFISSSTLGTISPGYVSELAIKSNYTDLGAPVLYTLIDGNLPPGLTLEQDGSIVGRLAYDGITTFDVNSYGVNKFRLDGGTTSIDKFFKFTVGAGNIYQQGITTATFTIGVERTTSTKITQIWSQPFLPLTQRKQYREFVNDPYTFDLSTIYRPSDSNFGIQQTPKMYIEFGIEDISLDDYFTEALAEHFSRKRFVFGDITYNQAYDDEGNYIYDAVYVTVIDTASNGILSTGTNSVLNWKNRLESISVSGNKVQVDNLQLPRFMRSLQPITGDQLGYVLVVPICYALPGKGATIVEKIGIYGFDFTTIDFTIDRLIVQDNLLYPGAKYLMFPTKDSAGNNLGQSLSYLVPEIVQGEELLDEDGSILYLG